MFEIHFHGSAPGPAVPAADNPGGRPYGFGQEAHRRYLFEQEVCATLVRIEEMLHQNQKEESRMSNDTHALVTRLVADVAAQGTVLASAETLLNGIPNVVREAVQQALAANPALTPEDLVAVTQAADSIEAQTGQLAEAVATNKPAAPPASPAGGQTGGGTTSDGGAPTGTGDATGQPPAGEVATG